MKAKYELSPQDVSNALKRYMREVYGINATKVSFKVTADSWS